MGGQLVDCDSVFVRYGCVQVVLWWVSDDELEFVFFYCAWKVSLSV